MGNTIVAGNSPTWYPDIAGVIVSSDHNLLGNTNGLISFGLTWHTIVGQDPLLAPLGNYGGPTPTMRPLGGSPAIDRGYSFGLWNDQRGFGRPWQYFELPDAEDGDGSDIGAFESSAPLLKLLRLGTNAQLSWWAYDPSFKLESTTNPGPSAVWQPVAATRTYSSNRFYVLDPMAQKKFYRLRSP
jgi:hypothetical protein